MDADPSHLNYVYFTTPLDVIDPAGLTINGLSVTVLDGQNLYRLFHVTSTGVLTLTSIQLHHGYAGSANSGGAIYNEGGTLTVTHSVFYSNQATTGGAIKSSGDRKSVV